MRRGRRLKKFNPNVKNPKMIEAPPSVNATGNPLRSRSKTTTKNINGRASKINFHLYQFVSNLLPYVLHMLWFVVKAKRMKGE